MSDNIDYNQQLLCQIYDVFQKCSTLHVPERSMYRRIKRIDRNCGGTLHFVCKYARSMDPDFERSLSQFIYRLTKEYEKYTVSKTRDDTYHIELMVDKIMLTDEYTIDIIINLYYKKLDKPTL